MGIIKDIGDLVFKGITFIKKEAKERQKEKAEIEKTFIRFNKEISDNRSLVSGLHSKGGLKTVKPNDRAFVLIIARIETSAMKKVRDYPKKYIKKPTKKIATFFELLSNTISKIDNLKRLTSMTKGELDLLPSVRLGVRIMYLNKCFDRLIKEA